MSTFSTSSRQKRLKTRSFFTLLTSKCASRHNGVHFFDTFSTSQLPKVLRDRQFLTLLTSKCASRHNGVHFFDISTSKSGPKLKCFVHFDLEMCFAPQRRALFRHRNFQKSSDAEVFCTFWLGNVLRATTACTFSTSQLPKVVRSWGVLYLLTWKCASRHNGVQFLIAPVTSWLRTRRFSEPTFRPSWATNHWKNTVFRDFPTFSRICIFFLLTLSLLIFSLLIFLFSLSLPYSAFHLSILSEVWLLNFLRSLNIINIRIFIIYPFFQTHVPYVTGCSHGDCSHVLRRHGYWTNFPLFCDPPTMYFIYIYIHNTVMALNIYSNKIMTPVTKVTYIT